MEVLEVNSVAWVVLFAPEVAVELVVVEDDAVLEVIDSLFRNSVAAVGNHGLRTFH